MAAETLGTERLRGWELALWVAQSALAALFAVTGAMRLFLPPEQLAGGRLSWADSSNTWWLYVSGLWLVFAALALVVPPLLHLGERLVPATATFMALAMVISMASHIMRHAPRLLAADMLVLGLCVFVVWGRVYKIRY